MAILVKKFGGKTLTTDEQVEKVARHLVEARDNGNSVVAVVSARGNQTNEIIDKIRKCGGPAVAEKIIDFAAAAGELESASCLAAALEKLGAPTELGDGRRIRLIASGPYFAGAVRRIENHSFITQALDEGKIVILAAYAGITSQGDTITLGRGGSDTFAVAAAAAIAKINIGKRTGERVRRTGFAAIE